MPIIVSTLSRKDMERMVKKQVISAGMLPKVHACLTALQVVSAKRTLLMDVVPHAVLLEIFH
ncbi:MAG: hypothetical protein R3B95_08860 [Nitrospirales bacterium]|nr:hypothetical protein [Nitrospirales bacterium]